MTLPLADKWSSKRTHMFSLQLQYVVECMVMTFGDHNAPTLSSTPAALWTDEIQRILHRVLLIILLIIIIVTGPKNRLWAC